VCDMHSAQDPAQYQPGIKWKKCELQLLETEVFRLQNCTEMLAKGTVFIIVLEPWGCTEYVQDGCPGS
jgi:hypothetical protein